MLGVFAPLWAGLGLLACLGLARVAAPAARGLVLIMAGLMMYFAGAAAFAAVVGRFA